jgi:RNA polymerase sigma factor (sigma-70 family)
VPAPLPLDPFVDPRSDAELLAAARHGDPTATSVLYARHQKAALRIATRYARHDYTAADLVSEAFTALLRVLAAGRGPEDSTLGYLAVSMRNAATSHARRCSHPHAPRTTPDDTLHAVADPRPDHDDVVVQAELQRELERALGSLRPSWRQMLVLTLVDGLSTTEAARQLGLTNEAARALAYRARLALRGALGATAFAA